MKCPMRKSNRKRFKMLCQEYKTIVRRTVALSIPFRQNGATVFTSPVLVEVLHPGGPTSQSEVAAFRNGKDRPVADPA